MSRRLAGRQNQMLNATGLKLLLLLICLPSICGGGGADQGQMSMGQGQKSNMLFSEIAKCNLIKSEICCYKTAKCLHATQIWQRSAQVKYVVNVDSDCLSA